MSSFKQEAIILTNIEMQVDMLQIMFPYFPTLEVMYCQLF